MIGLAVIAVCLAVISFGLLGGEEARTNVVRTGLWVVCAGMACFAVLLLMILFCMQAVGA